MYITGLISVLKLHAKENCKHCHEAHDNLEGKTESVVCACCGASVCVAEVASEASLALLAA